MKANLSLFLNRCLWLFCICATAGVFLLNLVFLTTVSYDLHELVSYHTPVLSTIAALVLWAGILFLVIRFKKCFCKLDEKRLFLLLASIYSLIAAYLILNTDLAIRYDAKEVSDAALAAMENRFDAFQPGNYLSIYPHQVGLMLYDMLLYTFSKNLAVHLLSNFVMVLGIEYLAYRLGDLIFANHTVNLAVIFFSFAFLPQLFLILFAYGNIPAFFFLYLAFYHTLKFIQTHRIRHLVVLLLSSAVSVLIRNNSLIGVIAILIILTLDMLKRFCFKQVLAILLLIAAALLPGKLLSAHFFEKADVEPSSGVPAILWIAMGTNLDNHARGPGWYDASSYFAYQDTGYDSQAAGEIGKQRLVQNLRNMYHAPLETVKFFGRKTISQWCDPLFQSIWSGPLPNSEQVVHTDLLYSLYTGGSIENILCLMMRIYMIGIWGFAAYYLLCKKQTDSAWQLFYLFFLGGLLFHTLWEGKSQYIFQYAFCLVPFAAAAFVKAAQQLSSRYRAKPSI